MRSSRLLALLLHLESHGPSTATELAELCEVSVRTIYRDIGALQAAGIPLYTETGPGGGVRLVEGWQSRVGGLTPDEAGVLALAGVPGAAGDLGLGPALAAAETKLAAGLSPELRARAAAVRGRFLLDAPAWHQRPDEVPHLAEVATGVFGGRRLDLGYRAGRGGRLVTRRVDPLGLVLKAGRWYLVAGHRDRPATYRVSRIATVRLRDEPARRPPGFELGVWWRTAAEQFEDAILHDSVRLRLSPTGLRWLPDVVPGGPTRRAVAAAEDSAADAEGWRVVDLPVESLAVALDQLVGLGRHVEVLAPPALRQAMAALGAELAARHARPAVTARSD